MGDRSTVGGKGRSKVLRRAINHCRAALRNGRLVSDNPRRLISNRELEMSRKEFGIGLPGNSAASRSL